MITGTFSLSLLKRTAIAIPLFAGGLIVLFRAGGDVLQGLALGFFGCAAIILGAIILALPLARLIAEPIGSLFWPVLWVLARLIEFGGRLLAAAPFIIRAIVTVIFQVLQFLLIAAVSIFIYERWRPSPDPSLNAVALSFHP